jgi:alkyldihydroxyacetonephosphate synthase
MNESALPVVQMHPYRWGNPASEVELPAAAAAALQYLGVQPPAARPVDLAEIGIGEPAIAAEVVAELRRVVGDRAVRTDDAARIAHSGGWSTPDLLRLRAGDAATAPDAVISPASHSEVIEVLQICSGHHVAVVPYSGGTSVVGGLSPAREGFAGVVALDLARLNSLEIVDAISQTATLQAGVRGPRAEALLAEHGFTLGHFPQSYEGASIGGYAATRSAGQASAGYGRFDEMVVGLVLATPRGTIALGTAPMSAAGPDLRQLVLGSEGTLGVITSVTVRVHRAPDVRVYEGWRFSSFSDGADALRSLAQTGPLPTVVRLSDETETAVNLADPEGRLGDGPAGCLAIVGYEGTAGEVAAVQAATSHALGSLGGENLGTEPGEAWRLGRYRAPYLRDPLLDAGALVETLETATFWSNLATLHSAVTQAVTAALTELGTVPVVLCHISHVYATGASLYFTVLCAQTSDPIAQWHKAKVAANAAIRSSGATITHHHGVGNDHRDAYADEVGPLAIELLHAVKATLDPAGILNPGILINPV